MAHERAPVPLQELREVLNRGKRDMREYSKVIAAAGEAELEFK